MLKIRKSISKSTYVLITVASFAIFILIWQLICTFTNIQSIFLPQPAAVLNTLIKGLSDGQIWVNTLISFSRIFYGFLLASLIGIPIGFIAGLYKPLEAFFLPISEFFRYMPVPAFVPLVMIWSGIGEWAKIIVILLGVLFQIIPMVVDDVNSVSQNYVEASYTLGANQMHVIFGIILPAVLPRLMDTLRMILGWAWTYLVVAELVAANSGLGFIILKAERFLKTDSVFMGILVIGILGLATDRIFALFNKWIFSWNKN